MARITLRIDFGGRHIGHGKIRLLELIATHGSISRAAREMGMSYRRAWLLADAVNTMFDERTLETRHGGPGGGEARLTPFGTRLVARYRAIEAETARAFAADLAELGAKLAPVRVPDQST